MSKKLIQCISDIHLENIPKLLKNIAMDSKFFSLEKKKLFCRDRKIFTHKPTSDILVLPGDIGNPSDLNYQYYIEYCSENHKKVFLIAGNHEYHRNKIDSIDYVNSEISDISKHYKNVIFLDNESYQVKPDLSIYGTTLWTPLTKDMYERGYDRTVIKNFDGKMRNKIYEQNRNKLEEYIKSNNENKIIMTHHMPSRKLIMPKFKEKIQSQFYACSIWEELKKKYEKEVKKIDKWYYGHTHQTSNDLRKSSTEVIEEIFEANPLGNIEYKKVEEIEEILTK
jgi:predicted phosphohydrolase